MALRRKLQEKRVCECVHACVHVCACACACVTCEDVFWVQLHVHAVLLRYVAHDPLGAAVLLSSQQPTQGLREDPGEQNSEGGRKIID